MVKINHVTDINKPLKPPRLVAWEVTRACNLACRHCRAEAQLNPASGELSHEEGLTLIEQIAEFGPDTILILTGGEPMMRPDVLELAQYGVKKGLRVVMSPNGTLINAQNARQMKEAGLSRLSVSVDGGTPEKHDEFRGHKGAFQALEEGLAHLRAADLPFQINTTITTDNMAEIEAIQDLAVKWGAVGHHVFLLVPTGRGANLSKGAADDYERVLKSLLVRAPKVPMEFKATCAPQYNRLLKQNAKPSAQSSAISHHLGAGCRPGVAAGHPGGHIGRGCLGGQGFVFISHNGIAQPCGYLPLASGHVRETSFAEIYQNSPIFLALRDKTRYNGKCGKCEYWQICGGCRARAHALGDYLGPEPLCPHQPLKPLKDNQ